MKGIVGSPIMLFKLITDNQMTQFMSLPKLRYIYEFHKEKGANVMTCQM